METIIIEVNNADHILKGDAVESPGECVSSDDVVQAN